MFGIFNRTNDKLDRIKDNLEICLSDIQILKKRNEELNKMIANLFGDKKDANQ